MLRQSTQHGVILVEETLDPQAVHSEIPLAQFPGAWGHLEPPHQVRDREERQIGIDQVAWEGSEQAGCAVMLPFLLFGRPDRDCHPFLVCGESLANMAWIPAFGNVDQTSVQLLWVEGVGGTGRNGYFWSVYPLPRGLVFLVFASRTTLTASCVHGTLPSDHYQLVTL